MKIRKCTF